MYRWLTAGLLTALGVLGTASDSRADDTYRLNIVPGGNTGTIQSGYSLADDDADVLDVYWRGGYGYGGYRGYYGGSRGYYGGYRGYYGGYGGYRGYGYGGYGYRGYGYGYGGYGYRGYGYGYSGYRGSYGGYRGYWGIADSATPSGQDYCLILPPEKAAPTGVQAYPGANQPTMPYELPGLNEQPKTFRYDGGPANPVPMPNETPSKGQPAPVDGKLVSQPAKLAYPAYGEAPRTANPVRDTLTGARK